MISNGKSKQELLGRLILMSVLFLLPIGILLTHMNSWVLRNVYVSLLLLIDAILLQLRLCLCTTVVHLLVPLVLVRLKLSRILVELWVSSSSSPTVLINIDTEIWLRSSRVWFRVVFGVASMNSIVLIWKSCLSQQCKSNLSPLLESNT